MTRLTDELKRGLDAPICLTWELTYGCNLACIHCLSSSGRRDPRELTTAEAMAVIDELRAMQVFYVNIGGGEPTIRSDFYELVDYAVGNGVGVKFSTNGSTITRERAERLAATDYLDVQISIDGANAATNDAVRGDGSFAMARRAMDHLAAADFGPFGKPWHTTRPGLPGAVAPGFGSARWAASRSPPDTISSRMRPRVRRGGHQPMHSLRWRDGLDRRHRARGPAH